ncbi:MAG: hypothetical protein EPO32_10445 [Anaerolineae bacterium]|nr:MAG: hypothetical protein EPO32_10445 [Anaerolineae bacterium]
MKIRALFLLMVLLGGLTLAGCNGRVGLDFGLEGEGGLGGLLDGGESEEPSDQQGDGSGTSPDANLMPLFIIVVLFLLFLMVGMAMGSKRDL